MTHKTEVIDAIVFSDSALEDTEEFSLGMREMRRRLPTIRRWYEVCGDAIPAVGFPAWSDAFWVLVIINPAILVSDNLLAELLAAATEGNHICVVPTDPRGFTAGVSLNYASRSGFDRFVDRLKSGPQLVNFDNREPWIYLVEREALAELGASRNELSWNSVPTLLGVRTAMANHAFVHSYADYHQNTRSEMLRLLPGDIRTLLDVGGGAGNFAHAFMMERGGRAALLERNPRAVTIARERGIEVLVGDFGDMGATKQFDCVAMLDVLEHLADPLSALLHARQFLQPAGVLLLSVPNVGHWSVVWDLLEGKFDYQPVGILCNTHVRFFTHHGLETMLADAGFKVERWENVLSPLPESFADFLNGSAMSGVNIDFESLSTESFHVLARRG